MVTNITKGFQIFVCKIVCDSGNTIVCLKINDTFYAKKIIGKTILLQTFIFGIKAYHVHIYLVVHKYFQKSVTITK